MDGLSRFSKNMNGDSLSECIDGRTAQGSLEDDVAVEVYSLSGTRPEPYSSPLYVSARYTARRVSRMLKYGL